MFLWSLLHLFLVFCDLFFKKTRAILRDGSLLNLLYEKVEHLCLYKLLYKSPCALRFDGFTEIPLLELASLFLFAPHDVLCKVANSFNKEW